MPTEDILLRNFGIYLPVDKAYHSRRGYSSAAVQSGQQISQIEMSIMYSTDGLDCVLGEDGKIKLLGSRSNRIWAWTDVGQDSDRWRAVVNAAMNIGARENARKLLTS